MVKKIKTVAENTQFITIKNATTIQYNAKKTFTKKREKTTRKKRETNKIFDIGMAI